MTVRVWMKKDGEEKVWTPQTDEEANDLIDYLEEKGWELSKYEPL